MPTNGNSPCTVTRVIERVATDIATTSREIDEMARQLTNGGGTNPTALEDIARRLRQNAIQLTGKAY